MGSQDTNNRFSLTTIFIGGSHLRSYAVSPFILLATGLHSEPASATCWQPTLSPIPQRGNRNRGNRSGGPFLQDREKSVLAVEQFESVFCSLGDVRRRAGVGSRNVDGNREFEFLGQPRTSESCTRPLRTGRRFPTRLKDPDGAGFLRRVAFRVVHPASTAMAGDRISGKSGPRYRCNGLRRPPVVALTNSNF